MNVLVRRHAAALSLTVFAILFFSSCSKEGRDFQRLKRARKDTQQSQSLAATLKDTHRGVQLALADIDCFGGETRGWSSWMLEKSLLSSEVDGALRRLFQDTSQSLSRRIEAARLLWLRTGELT